MNVSIITEGGRRIGLGHITRCVSLSQAFELRGIEPNIIVNGDDTILDLLGERRIYVFDWLKEKEKLFKLLKDAEIVIVDSYLAGVSLYKLISSKAKIPVYIDDNRRIEYPEGIIVNGTIFAEEFCYSQRNRNVYLLGTKYTPLRKCFWKVPEKRIKNEINNVIIMLGGCDSQNITAKITDMLRQEYPKLTKTVIAGKGYKGIEDIKKLEDSKTRIIFNPNPEKIKDAMIDADVAISAAGQSLYEFARMGIPTISVIIADNQLNNVRGWKKTGFIEDAGWYYNPGLLGKISLGLQKIQNNTKRIEKSIIGRTYVDGKGALRIVDYCTRKYYIEAISIRKAKMQDMLNVYRLSNETEVRNNSFNSRKIGLKVHKNWFLRKLRDKKCLFLIGEIGREYLGQVKFDINKNETVVGISVMKKYRGFGAGGVVLKKSIEILRKENPVISNIRAFVKKENVSSSKMFEKNGFKLIRRTKIKGYESNEYLYRSTEN